MLPYHFCRSVSMSGLQLCIYWQYICYSTCTFHCLATLPSNPALEHYIVGEGSTVPQYIKLFLCIILISNLHKIYFQLQKCFNKKLETFLIEDKFQGPFSRFFDKNIFIKFENRRVLVSFALKQVIN